jgi:hypothetical protein
LPKRKIANRRRSVQILDSHRPAKLIKGAVVYLDWTGENHGKSVVGDSLLRTQVLGVANTLEGGAAPLGFTLQIADLFRA